MLPSQRASAVKGSRLKSRAALCGFGRLCYGGCRRPNYRPAYTALGIAAVTQPFDTLANWLSSQGGNVGSITAGDCVMGEVTVRGLVALEDLAAGTPIISVPISSTVRDDKVPEAYPGAPWNANLAAHLLQEQSKGSASNLGPYLGTLPARDSCNYPLLLPSNLINEVQYEPAVSAITAYQNSARKMFDSWCEVRARGGLEQYSWQDWCWALHMVHSRIFRLAIVGCKAMLPGIDLLNHGGPATNGHVVLGKASWQMEGESAVVFVTTQHITAGQQVLLSYGTRGNDDFFVYRGFSVPNNPDEDVVLFDDVSQLIDWALQHVPQLRNLTNLQQQQQQQQQLEQVAVSAADRASQAASIRCPAAAIQGTSSSILLPLQQLTQELRQQQQQTRHHQQQQRQQNGSSGVCEAAVLVAAKRATLHRRLASFRLHRSEWGTSSCSTSIPELVLRCNAAVDVRLPAVIAALMDAAAAAAAARGFLEADSSSSRSRREDSVSQWQQQEKLADVTRDLIRSRCQELLKSFETTVEEDKQQLQLLNIASKRGGSSNDNELLMSVVQYRLEKKRLLKAMGEQLAYNPNASS